MALGQNVVASQGVSTSGKCITQHHPQGH